MAEGTFKERGKDFCYRIVDLKVHGTFQAYAPRLTPSPIAVIGDLLVLIFRCDHSKPPGESLTKAAIQFYFTLKSSNPGADAPLGIPSILELYDFVRNTSKNGTANTTKGHSMPTLMFFLKTILPSIKTSRLHIVPNTLLWLGTIEQRLAEAYGRAGFMPFGKGHTISPLGVQFPKPGWSFLLPISAKPPAPSDVGLAVAAGTLQRALTAPVRVDIDLPTATIRYIYETLVQEGTAENTLVFATQTQVGAAKDQRMTWNGSYFTATLNNFKHVQTPLLTNLSQPGKTGIPLTATLFYEHLKSNITGHTHPIVLYTIFSKTKLLDMSPPSDEDFNLLIVGQSPLHLVWTPECVYSIQIAPEFYGDANKDRILAEWAKTKPIRDALIELLVVDIESIEATLDTIYTGNPSLATRLPRVAPPPYDKAMKKVTVSVNSDEYLRYKQFKVELLCMLYSNSASLNFGGNTVNLIKVQPHFYRFSGGVPTGLNPPLSCITSTPYTLLTTEERLSTAEAITLARAHTAINPSKIVVTTDPLESLITFGKGVLKPCKGDICPPPAPGVVFRVTPSEGPKHQISFPEGVSLSTILEMSGIHYLLPPPAAAAGGAAATRIILIPDGGKLYSRSPQGILDITSLIITGDNTRGTIQSNAVKEDGAPMKAEITYPFSADVRAFLQGITVHRTARGGGARRRYRSRSRRRTTRKR